MKATLALAVDGLLVACDDTYMSGPEAGDIALWTALCGLNGEELSRYDLGEEMRDALAAIAIDWP